MVGQGDTGVEKDHLSKVIVARLRTQPDRADTVTSWETEQCITATASLASLSLEMGNTTHTVHSMSQNKQATSSDRLDTHSAHHPGEYHQQGHP